MVKRLLLLCLLIGSLGAEPPWGKDATLVPRERSQKRAPSAPFAQAISFHQRILSLADGPRSHFYPSSSEYARLAIERFGPATGFFLSCDRLMRENGERWVYKVYVLNAHINRKYDPVPLKYSSYAFSYRRLLPYSGESLTIGTHK